MRLPLFVLPISHLYRARQRLLYEAQPRKIFPRITVPLKAQKANINRIRAGCVTCVYICEYPRIVLAAILHTVCIRTQINFIRRERTIVPCKSISLVYSGSALIKPLWFQHRIQFDDTATRTFEYPSEASILEGETSSVDGETSSSAVDKQSVPGNNKISSATSSTTSMSSILGKIELSFVAWRDSFAIISM